MNYTRKLEEQHNLILVHHLFFIQEHLMFESCRTIMHFVYAVIDLHLEISYKKKTKTNSNIIVCIEK